MAGRSAARDMATKEIDRVGSTCQVALKKINWLINIIMTEHMELEMATTNGLMRGIPRPDGRSSGLPPLDEEGGFKMSDCKLATVLEMCKISRYGRGCSSKSQQQELYIDWMP